MVTASISVSSYPGGQVHPYSVQLADISTEKHTQKRHKSRNSPCFERPRLSLTFHVIINDLLAATIFPERFVRAIVGAFEAVAIPAILANANAVLAAGILRALVAQILLGRQPGEVRRWHGGRHGFRGGGRRLVDRARERRGCARIAVAIVAVVASARIAAKIIEARGTFVANVRIGGTFIDVNARARTVRFEAIAAFALEHTKEKW